MTPQSQRLWTKISQTTGFTLLELLVVIAIIGILTGVSYPLLKGQQPELKAKDGARQLESLLQRAKVLASSQFKPIRVVVDCSAASDVKGCVAELESAVYTEDEVTGWQKLSSDQREFDAILKAVKTTPTADFDGEETIPGIFWTIFMPNGKAFSNPRPFEVFLYHQDQKGPALDGWRVAVNNTTGRVSLTRDNFTPVP
jgi:prepilin-type N-terminal cleavage/methylation domain-containing protein